MLARNELIFRWTIYSLAALLCLFVQTALLQRFTIWGIVPFLYPLLAAIPATYENSVAATVFSLIVGILCDLMLPEVLPCFYTLLFPIIGLLSSLLAQSVLPNGFLCSVFAAAMAYLLNGLFHCLILWNSDGIWQTGMFLTLREFCVALPFTIPMTFLFRAVYRRTHWD